MDYNPLLREVFKSATFDKWFSRLRDRQAKARIAARIDRLAMGNPGDVRPVGSGVSEMRVGYGPGYRVYFTQRGSIVIVILCGGDKRTQDTDIERAIDIAASWKGENHDRES
jgi:putative addiction module killer protein